MLQQKPESTDADDAYFLHGMRDPGCRISFFPLCWLGIIIYSTPYMNGRAMTRGVFKAYVFFFVILSSCYDSNETEADGLHGNFEIALYYPHLEINRKNS